MRMYTHFKPILVVALLAALSGAIIASASAAHPGPDAVSQGTVDLSLSAKTVSTSFAGLGERITYTIAVRNATGPLTRTVLLTDVVPPGLFYVPDTLTATRGIVAAAVPTLTWSGVLTPTPGVTITYAAIVTYTLEGSTLVLPGEITNQALIVAPGHQTITRTTTVRTGRWNVYLPLFTVSAGDSPPPEPTRRVNIPYTPVNVPWEQTAIFWFGQNKQGVPSRNYTDVRVAYTDEALQVRATIVDYYLWYKESPSASDDLTEYDAVAIYVDTDLDRAAAPQTDDYVFLVGAHHWPNENALEYHRQARGDGVDWDTAWSGDWGDIEAMQWSCNPGPNSNECGIDFGWTTIFTIPWGTVGAAGPPPEGTLWGLGVHLYDRDDDPPAGYVAPEYWPETFEADSPATWGEIHFGYADHTPPPATPEGTTMIRAASPTDNTVEDSWMGGGGLCGGGHEGGSEVNHGDHDNLFVGTETAPTHFPCFNKSYLRFSLDAIPPGKTIISASLTLHVWGNAGDPGQAQPSWVHLFTISDPWDEMTIHWNNAPLAQENVSATWVYPYSNPGHIEWPGDPYTWDATQAVAEAYAAGQPVSLAIYGSDKDQHSSKYLLASETGDWNVAGRPALTVVWGVPAPGR